MLLVAVKLNYKSKTPTTTTTINILQGNNDLLELLQCLVVQAESRVSRQVELLQLGRQILRQRDLTQLVAAQVHALEAEEEAFILSAF